MSSFFRMNALTLVPTPMPPSSSATSPMSPRKVVSSSQKRRRLGWASRNVVMRRPGSGSPSASASRSAVASAPAGSRNSIRWRTRLPGWTRPVAGRSATATSARGPSGKMPARSGSTRMRPDTVNSPSPIRRRSPTWRPSRASSASWTRRALSADQPVEGKAGIGDEIAVERIGGGHRLQLGEQALAARARHRHQLHQLELRDARTGEAADGLPGRGRERPGRADLDVAAHQRARRARHRAGPRWPRGFPPRRWRPRRGPRTRARGRSGRRPRASRATRSARPAARRTRTPRGRRVTVKLERRRARRRSASRPRPRGRRGA